MSPVQGGSATASELSRQRQLLQELRYRSMKRRSLVDGYVPDDYEIHPLILVDEDVAQSGESTTRLQYRVNQT